MKQGLYILSFLLCFSCIPLRIAPNIRTDKVMLASKFKSKLPKHYSFIFEDPKEADQFLNYISIKLSDKHQNQEGYFPFYLNENLYFLKFYEIEKVDKTLNLLPILIDSSLESKDQDPLFPDDHVSRTGHWYLLLTVFDDNRNDCLNPDFIDRDKILKYLTDLRLEYLNNEDYKEVILKN